MRRARRNFPVADGRRQVKYFSRILGRIAATGARQREFNESQMLLTHSAVKLLNAIQVCIRELPVAVHVSRVGENGFPVYRWRQVGG